MKNIHILPTDKPSRLVLSNNSILTIIKESNYNFSHIKSVHIYITSDEEIKDGEYGICLNLVREGFKSHQAVFKMDVDQRHSMEMLGGQKKAEVLKVILTDDLDLIEDDIQEIPEEFIKWLILNPTCEFVEIKVEDMFDETYGEMSGEWYKIEIPDNDTDFLGRTYFDQLKQDAIEEEMEEYFNEVEEITYTEAEVKDLIWESRKLFTSNKYLKIVNKNRKFKFLNWFNLNKKK